jgi:membrane-associated phospholipid phosphatase
VREALGIIGRRQFLALSLGAALTPGCRQQRGGRDEPGGGRWRPMLIDPASIPRLPPPPPRGSATEAGEINELVGLTRRQKDPRTAEAIRFWATGASVRWNEIARDLVARHRTPPIFASRVYALLSVANYDTLISVWNNKYFYDRPQPAAIASELAAWGTVPSYPSYPSAHAAVSAASASVLSFIYPDESEALAGRAAAAQESRLAAGLHFRSDMLAGETLGRGVAAQVIEHARNDGADAVWSGKLRTGAGVWTSAAGNAPEGALWGKVKPWLMKSAVDHRAPPPPPYDSGVFRAALAEVRRLSATRTREQERTAALWADGVGSYTPPGRWNKIACDLILKHRLNELRAARVLALLNAAVMDAGIACWETKYHYLLIRPYQADPAITTPVGQPNFPSYTSAHATFSGAASAVLGGLFPGEAASLNASAEEAAFSRVLGGIHYRFDGDAGLAQGRGVAQLALARARQDGAS